jgi:hypothetical protein
MLVNPSAWRRELHNSSCLYVVQKKARNEDRKYRGSGGVAGCFAERKFS